MPGAAKQTQSKDKRRQYRSCDHCRSGKRACDATYVSVSEAIESKVACSNCRKKGRTCTFNYVLSILGCGVVLSSSALQLASLPVSKMERSSSSRSSSDHDKDNDDSNTADADECANRSTDDRAHQRSTDKCTDRLDRKRTASPTVDARNPPIEEASIDNGGLALLQRLDQAGRSSHRPAPQQQQQQQLRTLAFSTRATTMRSLTGWDSGWDAVRPDVLECIQGMSFQSASSRITSNLDRIYLNDGLIRVYEGAAEQALRCWVTSANTPYLLDCLSQSSDSDQGSNNSELVYWRICELDRGSRTLLGRESLVEDRMIMEAFHSVILAFAAQWAPNWVQTMAAQARGNSRHACHEAGCRVTENRVRLALWERAREKLQAVSSLDSFRVIFSLIIFAWTEKPREVQERATGRIDIDIADESCALDTSSWQSPAEGSTLLLVAALRKLLTIRFKVESKKRRGLLPWAPTARSDASLSWANTAEHDRSSEESAEGGRGEGSAMQRGLEEKQRTVYLRSTDSRPAATGAAAQAGEIKRMEDTYHMLWWLGVVIDCETAVLRKHPPVVSDEDSEVLRSAPYGDSLSGGNTYASGADSDGSGSGPKGIWDDYIIDYSKKRTSDLASTWPCDEASASATLSFSTPVKVVLFRQISRLQMSFWRRASSENVEQHISSGLNIVHHWIEVYAPLIDSCRRHHASLPPSIQSWYVLIACPWYLAVLLFVEMVQTTDMAGASDHRRRAERARSGTFPRLRVQACSDMASMIGAIQATGFFHCGGTFDFVCDSGGTVLHTEPWSEILVHSMSAVAKTEIRQHDGLCAQFRWSELEESRKRVEKCLWALEQLSDRSPSASLAFEQLSALAKTRTKQQFTIEQIPMASPMLPNYADMASVGSMSGDVGSLTPSSLAQVLEEFQGRDFATASDDGGHSAGPAALDGSGTSAGNFLDLFLSKQSPRGADHDLTRVRDEPTAGRDLEERSDISRSTLGSTAGPASHLFDRGPRHSTDSWPEAASSTTSAPYPSSAASSGKRMSEGGAYVEELFREERPRKVPREHLRLSTMECGKPAKSGDREACEMFFSPPLQNRPEYRDEAQMDEEFYVDGRAAEMLEHHRCSKERHLRCSREETATLKRKVATRPIDGSAAGTTDTDASAAAAQPWLDGPAGTVSDCEVDWSSIFALPL